MGTLPGHQKIAADRVSKLLFQAELRFKTHPGLSKRYVQLARTIAMKYRMKFSSEQKKLFCKKCNAYLKTGVNSRVRLERGNMVITCLECKNVRRIPYKK